MIVIKKIIQIGGSKGIVIPKEVLEKLNLKKGDRIYIEINPTKTKKGKELEG
jgi:antitoxin component of MazEF toxin-antitoxin module